MPASEDNSSLTTLQASAPRPGQAAATPASDPVAHPAPATTAGSPPSPRAAPVPRLSQGLQTLGEYKGSGTTERRYIVRRGDGQVIQLSRLLYLVVSSVDGVRDAETISHRVSGRYGAEVTTENIVHLVDHKLAPLGITAPLADRPGEVVAPRLDLLLALRGHTVIFHEGQVARIAAALAWLHRPSVVVPALAGVVAMDVWLFAVHGAMTPVLQVLEQPLWMLIIFALTVASLLFHEFGHASACRYSGAVPGKIGCGIFLIWPSMYTDVTDVYRIGRTGRLRTGLGGVYFNALFMLALTAAYLLTGQSFLLAAVYLAHFEVLEQLMPAVRLDGYYILGDLAGVPDLYGKVKPILLSLLPGRHQAAAQVADLRGSARTIVTVWVLTMVPLVLAEAAYALWNLPRVLATAARGLHDQCLGTIAAFTAGHTAAGLVGVIGALMLLCPMAGGAYLVSRLAVRLWRAAVKATEGRPVVRLALAAATAAGCTVLATAWMQGLTPQPLPQAAPVTPVLQPDHPAPRTASPSPAHTTGTHPATRRDAGATPEQSRSAPAPHPTARGPHTGAAPSPTASPATPTPGTGTPGPTTSAGTTSPLPSPSASPSPPPTASPSLTSSPSQPPSTSPSAPATAPSTPSHL
ncbi:hypothetical protein [Streptomyces sp. NBC_00557]|uniref:hypothetical protein n=1 Tax=Streptomyces sp. NBC_00557 TaxID=2975776 RepID=UPI002E80D583|nr:hypothetical protein [Streptomyces sp. NBC_00557]WUC40264.1 hypothetical protein OG956_39585 [Streptomyces sp. NBC_00557]